MRRWLTIAAVATIGSLALAACTSPQSTPTPSPSSPAAVTEEPVVLPEVTAPSPHWEGVDCLTLFGSSADRFGPLTTGDMTPAMSAETLQSYRNSDAAAEAQSGVLYCSLAGAVDGRGTQLQLAIIPGAAEIGRPLLGAELSGDIRTTDDSAVGCTVLTETYGCMGTYIVDGDWISLSYGGTVEDDIHAIGDELISAALARLAELPETSWQRPATAWPVGVSCDAIDPTGAAAAAAGVPAAAATTPPRGMLAWQRVAFDAQGLLDCAEGDTLTDSPSTLSFSVLPGGSWMSRVPADGTHVTRVEPTGIEGAPAAAWIEYSAFGSELPESGPFEVLEVYTDGGLITVSGALDGVLLDRPQLLAAAEVLLALIEAD